MDTVINFLGASLDAKKEYELFKNDNLGFKIIVTYTSDSWRFKQGRKTDIFNNVTEFHWRFNETEEEETTKEVAFESDIKACGFTRKISEIESIFVDYETEVG